MSLKAQIFGFSGICNPGLIRRGRVAASRDHGENED